MEKVSSRTYGEQKQDTPVLNPEDTWATLSLFYSSNRTPGRKAQPQINLHSATVVAPVLTMGRRLLGHQSPSLDQSSPILLYGDQELGSITTFCPSLFS